jgi:competence protein ComEC
VAEPKFSLTQILSIALLGLLIPDPWAVLSAGFWLSFGAVALILYVTAHRISRSHFLHEYRIVQLAMTVGLIPLLLAMFKQITIVSPIANAFAIPLVSLIVVPLTFLGTVLQWDVPPWLAHIVMDRDDAITDLAECLATSGVDATRTACLERGLGNSRCIVDTRTAWFSC